MSPNINKQRLHWHELWYQWYQDMINMKRTNRKYTLGTLKSGIGLSIPIDGKAIDYQKRIQLTWSQGLIRTVFKTSKISLYLRIHHTRNFITSEDTKTLKCQLISLPIDFTFNWLHNQLTSLPIDFTINCLYDQLTSLPIDVTTNWCHN